MTGAHMGGVRVLDLQLLLVRSLIDRARQAVRDGSAVGTMTATVLVDSAVETMTKTVCQQRGIRPLGDDAFSSYLQELERAYPPLKARRELSAVQRLRRNRNAVQHDGAVLDAAMAGALVEDGEAYCRMLAREILHEELATVSSARLVQNPALRCLLEIAARHRAHGRAWKGVITGLAAYDFLGFTWTRAVRMSYEHEGAGEAQPMARVSEFLGAVGIVLEMPGAERGDLVTSLARITLGLSVEELLRIRQLQAIARGGLEDDLERAGTGGEVSEGDVDFLVDVVGRAAWRLEAGHPSVLQQEWPRSRQIADQLGQQLAEDEDDGGHAGVGAWRA